VVHGSVVDCNLAQSCIEKVKQIAPDVLGVLSSLLNLSDIKYARLLSKPFWAMSKCFDISTLVNSVQLRSTPFNSACQRCSTPSKSLSKLVKLGHSRRYGAHFEDLDEAHPSRVLQEASSLHPVSNIKKTAFLPCQNSVKMSSAIQQVLLPLHESSRPLIHYVGPNQLEQNTSTIKTNALYAE
jgi:hypothetical protein